eukprot:Protomagalhaensia_sp_Gyna_25__1415@NODE_1714_length_1592_cov_133_971024_g1404_i0_p1_GENE_NODE_1714_length_1592_cov_133_971024_g1404_i0NODE_1714_length_1592_cov_133_971024_g1404_i0_p1_ORF_typecomplete_len205_score26_26Proteasome/PF00227_26/6_1e35_NODE_1714_length_1592_cov_133_971024_g1404_i0306920
MSIMDLHGGSCLVMLGKDSVAVVVDKRLSNQLQLVSDSFERAFPLSDKVYFAAIGFASDVQTAFKTLRFHAQLYKLREDRDMPVQAARTYLANLLYQRRFGPWFIGPHVAGINSEGKPEAWGFDLIGTPEQIKDFNAAGTGFAELFGVCEKKYVPDLDATQLKELALECFLSAMDRDCLSGNGAVCHLITPQGTQRHDVTMRVD